MRKTRFFRREKTTCLSCHGGRCAGAFCRRAGQVRVGADALCGSGSALQVGVGLGEGQVLHVEEGGVHGGDVGSEGVRISADLVGCFVPVCGEE